MKRKLGFILVLAIALCSFSVPTFASYNDISGNEPYAEAVESLTRYGIVSGYNGKFSPNNYVTRAEFAKMITLASGLEDIANSNTAIRRFDDVPTSHWANGYINTSAQNSLIVGYPNGKFMPENNVTFAEAVTVILRAMNYSSKDLGDNWPYAYMVKAKSLGLTNNINLKDNDYISRGNLAIILDRGLHTNMNGGTEKLVSKMNVRIGDETLVIATKNEDSSLRADEVKTSSGTYTLVNSSIDFEPLTKVQLIFDEDGKVMSYHTIFSPKKVATTVSTVVNGVVYFGNGTNGDALGVDDSTQVYSNGSITKYDSYVDKIEPGSVVSIVYDENGTVGYLAFNEANYSEPVVLRSDVFAAMETLGVPKEVVEEASVIRNGDDAELTQLQKFDVLYFLSDNNTIYAFSDKISGVYTEAYPNKSNVTKVDISGTELDIETKTAASKLSGTYKINSKITALLGKDGKIVDVVDLNSVSGDLYGILLSCNTEISEETEDAGKQYNYISVLNSQGNTVSYKTKGDYSKKIGDVGKISFDEDGYVSFGTVGSTNTNIRGEIDKNNRKIGDFWLTQDCVILERTYVPESRMGTASAKVISLDDFSGNEFSAKNLLYAVTTGAFNDISLMVVEGITDSEYEYGVLTGSKLNLSADTASGSYTIFSKGKSATYSAGFATNIKSGVPVAYMVEGGKLTSIKALSQVKATGSLAAIDFARAKVDGKIYMLSQDVQILKRSPNGTYTGVSINDADELVGLTVNLYADGAISNGGQIRLITINNL